MKFGPVPLDQALGAILAHSLDLPEGRLRKGMKIDAEAVEKMRYFGVSEVVAAQLEEGDVHEDAAALELAQALAPEGSGLKIGRPGTGRVNLFAEAPGVARIDAAKVQAVNAIHPMITLATVPEWQRMARGGMVATVKIISYAVPGQALSAARGAGRGALALCGLARPRVTLIQSFVGEQMAGNGPRAISERLERLGAGLVAESNVSHDEESLSLALAAARDAAASDLILLLTGSATSDPDDVGPAALRHAGGQMIRFGMPVDPGNLLFLGDLAGCPVIGLPGCARSPALNGADWVLERLLCGVEVTSAQIAAMGVGGLLKEIPTRPQPRDPK
ncbi:molybdenum cofactor cytidylyltransferase [Pseudooceanicola antarcticus]|uniref:Molybdenum cofactor cytidylyltransferase n=1 Tax=Pseudooceanicola antarcticus TaxID=1247613 RepID=A0A285J2R6_9RHOB|nr:molybdopterin-binding protein [Pseudooceanicola antarcticus]PJE29833.1 molybdopterin biosynthesis protein [Pseudooceanicola antarcticus]SNY54157.1 molybdenum cofactor cytidylyltransferase [Pseudooceanicola antarcticus]